MLEKKYNAASKQFMQKILVFIDTVLLNATNSSQEETNKILFDGILNIRDAMLSEIIKDNHIESFNQFLEQQVNSKKNQEEKDKKDLNQGKESDNVLQA